MVRREVPLDARRILHALAEHRVDYLVIGGLAVQAHGHVRTTQDVDLLPDPTPENLDRLAATLRSLRARPAGEGPRPDFQLDAAAILATDPLSLDTGAGGVDVHRSPSGGQPFAVMRRRALTIEVVGLRVPVVGRDDLIAMKRAAGRPVDRGDVIALTEVEVTELRERGSRPVVDRK
ncbi:hypothetical protein BH20ACT18_BH20ACT18_11290 [soil metagenome]